MCQSNGSCNLSVWRQSFIIGIRNNAIPSRPESSVATAVGPGRSTPAITTSTITTMTEIAATTRAGLASGRITPEMVIGLPRQPRQLKETQISSEIGKQLKTRKGAKARISESEFSGSNLRTFELHTLERVERTASNFTSNCASKSRSQQHFERGSLRAYYPLNCVPVPRPPQSFRSAVAARRAGGGRGWAAGPSCRRRQRC